MPRVSGQVPRDCGKTGGNTQSLFLNAEDAERFKVRMRGVTILESGGATALSRRILNPAQGLESSRVGGEVRVMTCIRV
jgi:hypothetical protein